MMIVSVIPRAFRFLRVAAVAVVWAGAATLAHAAADNQTFLGQHGAWYAYLLHEDGARTCYMVSKPVRTRGNFKKRGDVVAFVTHRPKEGERDVVSFQAGYTYKAGGSVAVKIGDKTFSLFTSKDTAWSRNPSEDKEVVHAMISGNTMDVKGTPLHGGDTTDIYSLRGFTAAYKRITRACGLK
jgi:invasion protein IalB